MIKKWYTIEVTHNGTDWESVGTDYPKKEDAIKQFRESLKWYKAGYRCKTQLRMTFHKEESWVVDERTIERG